jgi:Chaperone of endosialidase
MKQPIADAELRCLGTKRVYVPPALTCYGLVQDLTQSGTGQSNESASPAGCPVKTNKPNANCPSDSRLKTNIRSMSASSGLPLYLFEYKPEFKSSCGHGTYFGFMAQDVLQKYPSAVVTRPDGYYAINYRHLRQLLQ